MTQTDQTQPGPRALSELEQQFVTEAEDGCLAVLRDENDRHPYTIGAPKTGNLFSPAAAESQDPAGDRLDLRTRAGVSDPFTTLPRARATGWRGWVARALGTKIVRETEHERVTAYSWRGALYVAAWFPSDANFYHD